MIPAAAKKLHEIARLWEKGAEVSIFGAEARSKRGGNLTIHPLKDGKGYMMVVWNGRSLASNKIVDCVADGGRCAHADPHGAILEGVELLLKCYPPPKGAK